MGLNLQPKITLLCRVRIDLMPERIKEKEDYLVYGHISNVYSSRLQEDTKCNIPSWPRQAGDCENSSTFQPRTPPVGLMGSKVSQIQKK